MDRIILHCDLNNFYASVECFKEPTLRNQPVVVAGNEELRHGIVLAKNQMAKQAGIKTGQTIWEAKQRIEDLIVLPPDFKEYQRYSKMVKEIFRDYTDRIEDFGIDESWLDVSGSRRLFGDGMQIATTIQKRILHETGLSSSIGISFNKIFAKLGSDYQKPMGLTYISKENYKEIVWPLPVSDLLYVGSAHLKRFSYMGIQTIGDLANYDHQKLKRSLGKWGEYLWLFANGRDTSEVARQTYTFPVKSIGNGITPPRDIKTIEEFRLISYVLCESVVARMREQHVFAKCVTIGFKTKEFISFTKRESVSVPLTSVHQLMEHVMSLCERNYAFDVPLRYISIHVSSLVSRDAPQQLSLFEDAGNIEEEKLDIVMEEIRQRFGTFSIRRCSLNCDMELTNFDPLKDHTIHPVNFFR